MYYKSITLSILLIIAACTISSAQKRQKSEFGNPTSDELAMQSFPQDPEASAVILFEQGNYYFKVINDHIRLVKEVYQKIKVIDAQNFDRGSIEIALYKSNSSEEKIKDLQAITHNGQIKKYVASDKVYTINQSKNFSVVRFSFPDIKDGSIVEYRYKIESPFFFNFNGWQFQNNIPTLYSEFVNEIPGNFNYNRILKGGRKLDIEDASIKKSCFHIEGYTSADCELAIYAMKNIPAYKEEKHMLAKSNYIAMLEYELRDFLDYGGSKNTFSKTWEDVDRNFKHDKDIGKQLNNTSYFKRNMPENLLSISDNIEKAQAIYSYIQKRIKWNNKLKIFDTNVKDAFENKVGNSAEINLALINALQAADLDAKLVLLSTRENGLPTSAYPVLTDFNHAIALLTVNNEEYLLDAIEKETPFGVLPFQDLNGEGRVMDFKKDSYWRPLSPHNKNVYYVNTQLKATDDGVFSGFVNELYTGYTAINERKRINNTNYEDYVNEKEKNASFQLSNLKIEDKETIDKPLKIKYEIALDTELIGDKVYLNPYFFETFFSENPFSAETRDFPINFGYPVSNTYLISIDLANNYTVAQLPENKRISLFDNIGECTVVYTENSGKINIRFSFKLTKPNFTVEAYPGIKKFFEAMISFQNQDPILLKKI